MSIRKTILLLLVFLLFSTTFILTGCTSLKRDALEGDALLAVVVEGGLTGAVKPMLTESLERIVNTPQAEQRFYLKYVKDDSLGRVSRWSNVLLVGTLDSEDAVSQRVKRMLNDETLQGVQEGKFRVFRQKDVWAKGQTVVVLVAPNEAELTDWLLTNKSEVYEYFASDRYDRMKRKLYSLYEQKSLSDSLQTVHGWHLRIPHDFGLVNSNVDPNYVRFRRMYPDRFLTVGWKYGYTGELNKELYIEWRNEVGKTFADEAIVNPQLMVTEKVKIAGYDALKIHGLWETTGILGGGPFVGYLLQKEEFVYFLDGQVFAPDRSKEMYIRQLEIILTTFKP